MSERRALVVSAHPDDIEFGCAGTVASWVDDGWDVRYVIVTSGQKGVQDVSADPDEFGALREAESVEAAKRVGVTDVTFLRWMDSELLWADQRELRRQLARQYRIHRPHRLVTMDSAPEPGPAFVNHPDHRTVGIAVLDMSLTGGTTAAIFPELLLDEGLEPWRGLEETWIFGPGGGPVGLDIGPTLERKLHALAAHASQLAPDTIEFLRGRLAERGAPFGYAAAESFRVIPRLRP